MSVQNEVETVVGELMAEDFEPGRLRADVPQRAGLRSRSLPASTAVARAHQAVFASEVSIPDPEALRDLV